MIASVTAFQLVIDSGVDQVHQEFLKHRLLTHLHSTYLGKAALSRIMTSSHVGINQWLKRNRQDQLQRLSHQWKGNFPSQLKAICKKEFLLTW